MKSHRVHLHKSSNTKQRLEDEMLRSFCSCSMVHSEGSAAHSALIVSRGLGLIVKLRHGQPKSEPDLLTGHFQSLEMKPPSAASTCIEIRNSWCQGVGGVSKAADPYAGWHLSRFRFWRRSFLVIANVAGAHEPNLSV